MGLQSEVTRLIKNNLLHTNETEQPAFLEHSVTNFVSCFGNTFPFRLCLSQQTLKTGLKPQNEHSPLSLRVFKSPALVFRHRKRDCGFLLSPNNLSVNFHLIIHSLKKFNIYNIIQNSYITFIRVYSTVPEVFSVN